MGPDIMALLLVYSKPGRIMDPTGLALERGIPQSPEPPMGDLWGTMPLPIGPDGTQGGVSMMDMEGTGSVEEILKSLRHTPMFPG